MVKARKRFIAGAICPACQETDSLLLSIIDEQERVECVACGQRFDEPPKAETSSPEDKPIASKDIIGLFKPES